MAEHPNIKKTWVSFNAAASALCFGGGLTVKSAFLAVSLCIAGFAFLYWAYRKHWGANLDAFETGLGELSVRLDPNWSRVATAAVWPAGIGLGAGPLGEWAQRNETKLEPIEARLLRIARAFYAQTGILGEPVHLKARKAMRLSADSWGWSARYGLGFHKWFHAEVVRPHRDAVLMLAYLEIALAEKMERERGASAGLVTNWATLGDRCPMLYNRAGDVPGVLSKLQQPLAPAPSTAPSPASTITPEADTVGSSPNDYAHLNDRFNAMVDERDRVQNEQWRLKDQLAYSRLTDFARRLSERMSVPCPPWNHHGSRWRMPCLQLYQEMDSSLSPNLEAHEWEEIRHSFNAFDAWRPANKTTLTQDFKYDKEVLDATIKVLIRLAGLPKYARSVPRVVIGRASVADSAVRNAPDGTVTIPASQWHSRGSPEWPLNVDGTVHSPANLKGRVASLNLNGFEPPVASTIGEVAVDLFQSTEGTIEVSLWRSRGESGHPVCLGTVFSAFAATWTTHSINLSESPMEMDSYVLRATVTPDGPSGPSAMRLGDVRVTYV